ncbi:hypothetical protein BGX33_004942 [Mortierella sp. NVP41]|nr:hypothetical protein BGX33_004942 [Mortierella sp. NVP41]
MMVPWEGLGTAWLYKKKDLLCKNVYEIATMSNSWFCGVQGITLMYIVLVMLCLGFLLIANLHFLTVYRSSVIQTHLTKLIALSFFLPLSLVLPVAIRKQIENPGFGSICFVSSEVASPYFFYPLSVAVCLATLLHLGTIVFMIKTSIQNNAAAVSDSTSFSQGDGQSNRTMSKRQRRLQTARDISQLLKQQWRPGFFALCLLIIDMIYWLFYFIEAKKLSRVSPDTKWFNEWLECLGAQAQSAMLSGQLSATSTLAELKAAGETAQGACARIATPNVPSFAWAALSDIMPAVFGIMILIIFGTKLELWRDLRIRIFGERDSTVFNMDDLNKDHHRTATTQEQQHYPHAAKSEVQPRGQSQNNDFYSDDLGMETVEFNSRDMMILHTETPQYGGKQSRSRSGSQAALPLAEGSTYGGATRKTSVTIQDDREPIYYRKPEPITTQEERIQLRLLHEQHAKLVSEGSHPWPAWPSSTTTTSSPSPTSPVPPVSLGARSPSFHRYPRDLTVNTLRDPLPQVTFPTSPISPLKGFYNSDDITAPPIPLSQHSRIDRQLTSPPPALPQPTFTKVDYPVQSVVIPSRGSSRDQ